MPDVVKVFISYAYSDIEYKERIDKFLKKNVARNKVELFADSSIKAGENREKRSGRIYKDLYMADLYILLLTPNYLASELLGQEAKLIIDNAKSHESQVIPVFLKYCDIPDWITDAFPIFPNSFDPIVSHQVEENISRSDDQYV